MAVPMPLKYLIRLVYERKVFLVQPLTPTPRKVYRGTVTYGHTQEHITVGRTPLDKGSARRR